MIGIYRITNKLNNKSYIGQSVHCGKRLDEHSKGTQLIDEIIQIEGIENFQFEILKEVEKSELNYWEDFFIIKFGTMFPDGYNKKWNCNKETRKEIEKIIKRETIEINQSYEEQEVEQKELTGNLFKTYIGLFYHSICKGKTYSIVKNIEKISRTIKLERKTLKKFLNELEELKIIKENNKKIIIKNLAEITDFITYEEFENFNHKELFVLWRIRSENSYGIEEFYLRDLYWNGKDKKLATPINNEIRGILNTLQEQNKIVVKFPENGNGYGAMTQINATKGTVYPVV